MDDQHRQELLRSSPAYAFARLAFANAIVIAQRAGADETEIAPVTGLSVPGIRAVLRSLPSGIDVGLLGAAARGLPRLGR